MILFTMLVSYFLGKLRMFRLTLPFMKQKSIFATRGKTISTNHVDVKIMAKKVLYSMEKKYSVMLTGKILNYVWDILTVKNLYKYR